MSSNFDVYLEGPFPESLTPNRLSIALIGPNDTLRKAAVSALAGCHEGAVREFNSYPPGLDDLPKLLDQHHDIVLIELDSNPEYALDLVEGICASGLSTVMVYSHDSESDLSDPDLLMRCMRAGAREFLSMPFANNSMAEALVRAAARRPLPRIGKKANGRLLVFCGAKGGAGVTAIACGFAVGLAEESAQSTLLIDLDLPMGDVAINLGINAEYSAIDALQNFNRLDSSFLSKLIVKHRSGLCVLAAPGSFSAFHGSSDSFDKLLTVARQDFENVVVDVGSKINLTSAGNIFKHATTIYLVTQSGIPELRNANRVISQCFSAEAPKLEIVLNRTESRGMKITDEEIKKALSKPARWKIPNDYTAVRRMQDTATPLGQTDSSISWQIDQMARAACGLPEVPQKKKGFSFKNLGRNAAPKGQISDDSPGILRLGLISGENASAEPGKSVPDIAAFGVDDVESGQEQRPAFKDDELRYQTVESETRTYNGKTYARGEDGQWSRRETQPDGTTDEAPTVEWLTPEQIPYGTALDKTQFNAAASVPGRFIYTPSEGYVLPVGAYTLWATFIPEGEAGRTAVLASAVLSVTKALPTITWPRPSAIPCGTALSIVQLNATASVPGTFEYIPADGDIPSVGIQSLLVAFTPEDTANFNTAQAEVPLTVTKAASRITWEVPAAISYGEALGTSQLNAVASVPGTLIYTPGEGSILVAGKHTISVAFTPADALNHTSAEAEVSITVNKAVSIITWPKPHAISCGTALSSAELNAVSSVPGKFVYMPGEGAVLSAGRHTPIAIFTPTDTSNYTTAQAAVSLSVTKAVPTLQWPTPDPISYGTPLSNAELKATASVPGSFVYTPAIGAILPEGDKVLSVTFTPIDSSNFTNSNATVTIAITKAAPIDISWPPPAALSYGTPLSAAQLNARASVAGVFVYSPSEGEVLAAGNHTLAVTFIPADSNLPKTQSRVELAVAKSRPTITWSAPRAICYGATLSSTQLNANASIPGTFTYAPPVGELPKAGKVKLSVAFTPIDTANYIPTKAEVSLTVAKAKPIIGWAMPDAISYGSPLGVNQLNAVASIPGKYLYAPASGTVLAPGTQTLSVAFVPEDSENYMTAECAVTILVNELSGMDFLTSLDEDPSVDDPVDSKQTSLASSLAQVQRIDEKREAKPALASSYTTTATQAPATRKAESSNMKRGVTEIGSMANRESESEIRTYKGATYMKGADGQWHLQQK